MRKFFALVLAVMMLLSLAACSGSSEPQPKPEVIKEFDQLDPAKFHGALSGDGYFLVLYEGVIDDAVMGAVLSAEGGSVTLSEATIVKNPDGNSLLFFEQVTAKLGDTIPLTLEKEGYDTLSFTVTVEYN